VEFLDRSTALQARRAQLDHFRVVHPNGVPDCPCEFWVWMFAKRKAAGCGCLKKKPGQPKRGVGICYVACVGSPCALGAVGAPRHSVGFGGEAMETIWSAVSWLRLLAAAEAVCTRSGQIAIAAEAGAAARRARIRSAWRRLTDHGRRSAGKRLPRRRGANRNSRLASEPRRPDLRPGGSGCACEPKRRWTRLLT